MGLVICVGLLVDNSVVMAENIHRHHQEGIPKWEACIRGVREIGFAITIATFTTLIVFSSTLLIDGKMRFFAQKMFSPVFAAIIASLIAALMFIPLCVYLTLPNDSKIIKKQWSFSLLLEQFHNQIFSPINNFYNHSLKFFLQD